MLIISWVERRLDRRISPIPKLPYKLLESLVISSHAKPWRSHSLISLRFEDVLPKIAQQFGVSRVVVLNKTFLSLNSLNSMLEEPLASNTSEENSLVTTVILM